MVFTMSDTQAQNANIGSKACYVQKAGLPINYTDADARYYSLVTKGSYAYGLDNENKRLFGWQVDEVNPVIKAVVSLYGFSVNSPKRQSKKVEKKDKDGKVISSYTEYWYEGRAVGNGTLYIYGHQNEFSYSTKTPKAKKGPTKAELRAEEEQKKLEDNPFLTEEVIDDLGSSEIEEDSGLEGLELPLARRINIDKVKTMSSNKFKSGYAALQDYRTRVYPALSDFRAAYPQGAYNNAINALNRQYGFAPNKSIFRLKTIKNDKHPESKLWNNATDAAIQIFKLVRFNKPVAKQKSSMMAIIDYFVTQVERNSEDDKKQRKVKKAALENLMNIYYFLDMHDEVLAIAGKHLESKKLGKMAERMEAKSKRQSAHLAFLKMNSAHLDDDTMEFDEGDIVELEEEGEADDGK